MGIYPHNSEHILKTTQIDEGSSAGIHQIGIIEDENTLRAYHLWKRTNWFDWKKYTYEETISLEEKIRLERFGLFFAEIFFQQGLSNASVLIDLPELPLSSLIEPLIQGNPNPPLRWDIYTLERGSSNSELPSGIPLARFIPSNIPTIKVNEPRVKDNQAFISWEGSDKTTYDDVPISFPDNTDITIFLGPTEDPDLYYELRLFKEGSDGLGYIGRWLNLTTTSKTLDDLVNGKYAFEVCVFDEIGNGDVSNMVPFTIDAQQVNTIILQPGPEGKDAYIKRFWVLDAYFKEVLSQYENENYGNESSLYAGYLTRPISGYYKYWRYATYIQFSLDQIPKNANISSAKLYTRSIVRVSGPDTSQSLEVKLRNIETPWNESTVTWNTRGSWGNEFESLVLSSDGNDYYWTEWDITDLVSSWHNSTLPNYGLVLDATLGPDYGPDYKIISSDSSDTTHRPKLVIEYTQ